MGVKRWIKRQIRVLREPQIRVPIQCRCATQTFGTEDGVWTYCPTFVDSSSVIYSVGIGSNVSFDLMLIAHHGVEVHGFDPTPKSLEWVKGQSLPSQFKVHPYGLASFDGEIAFNPPMKKTGFSYSIMDRSVNHGEAVTLPVHRLATVMRMLGHSQIDILKMDVEGAEYEIVRDLISQRIPVRQILVEYHDRFANVGVEHTIQSIQLMNQAGYRIFAVSSSGREYSLIKDGGEEDNTGEGSRMGEMLQTGSVHAASLFSMGCQRMAKGMENWHNRCGRKSQ